MAEFQEVMKNYERMCKEHLCTSACPMYKIGVCEKLGRCVTEYGIEKVEQIVMSWAAEHPEPVYPSVAKYLEQFGIIIRRDGSVEADFFRANEPMSAEMAKLLGISLGEGENEKTD